MDVPSIVYKYHEHLIINAQHVKKNVATAWTFDSSELEAVKDLLCLMIVASNKGGIIRVEHGKIVFISSSHPQPSLSNLSVHLSMHPNDNTPLLLPQPNELFPVQYQYSNSSLEQFHGFNQLFFIMQVSRH